MPELPEVEAARRAIADHCLGKKIVRAIIADDTKVVDGVSRPDFEASLMGKTIVNAHRKGKNMWIQLDSPPFPSFQFGMAGAIYIKGVAVTKYKRAAVKDTDEWPSKYSKFFVELDDGLELSFTDKRRFAKVRLLKDPASAPPISELGPDALLEPRTVDEFHKAISKKKIAIKALLLDQSYVSGIGNWIADEVLYQLFLTKDFMESTLVSSGLAGNQTLTILKRKWLLGIEFCGNIRSIIQCRQGGILFGVERGIFLCVETIEGNRSRRSAYEAQIHPLQVASSLSKESCEKLQNCIKEVIEKAIEVGADSSQYPENWIFHSREKKPDKAFVDGKKIEFITAGGRTTAYVPELQMLTGTQAEKEPIEPKNQRSKSKRGKKKDEDETEEEDEEEAELKPTNVKSKKMQKTKVEHKKLPAKRTSKESEDEDEEDNEDANEDDDGEGHQKKKTVKVTKNKVKAETKVEKVTTTRSKKPRK